MVRKMQLKSEGVIDKITPSSLEQFQLITVF
jgi:hypothetical protein